MKYWQEISMELKQDMEICDSLHEFKQELSKENWMTYLSDEEIESYLQRLWTELY